jgi:hypothetical protein
MTDKIVPQGQAISIRNQQKAALYGIAATLVGIHGMPDRKKMKRVVKRLSKELKRDIGGSHSREIMQQNKGAVEIVIVGIRKFPTHTPEMISKMIEDYANNLLVSYHKGIANLGYGES